MQLNVAHTLKTLGAFYARWLVFAVYGLACFLAGMTVATLTARTVILTELARHGIGQ